MPEIQLEFVVVCSSSSSIFYIDKIHNTQIIYT